MGIFDYEKTDEKTEYYELLWQLMERWENELVEFKEAKGQYSEDKIGKYFSAMFDSIQGKHFTANMNFDLLTLRLISSLRNIDSNVLKFALNIDVNSLSEDDFTKLASIALSDKRNINVSLESKEDLKTYDERFNKKCDEVFKDKVEGNNIDAAKNAYFNKYYGMSFENVLEMISKYGYSLDNLDLSDESIRKNYDYLMGIKILTTKGKLEATRGEPDSLVRHPVQTGKEGPSGMGESPKRCQQKKFKEGMS